MYLYLLIVELFYYCAQIGSFTPINENNMMYEYKLKLIQMHLDMMNKIDNGQRTFTIIEEII
jgi:hypothetical protein